MSSKRLSLLEGATLQRTVEADSKMLVRMYFRRPLSTWEADTFQEDSPIAGSHILSIFGSGTPSIDSLLSWLYN